ncbi:unnamed protein product [Paramecium pentaurelia]|uniref:Uncharacterized protein n=1 Tax=Paramecium pentaurelia TaxID=43138 RepID=A0A8S1Y9U5_9CILI|nr:unnamed protein product [Paramecium pentaurelia]
MQTLLQVLQGIIFTIIHIQNTMLDISTLNYMSLQQLSFYKHMKQIQLGSEYGTWTTNQLINKFSLLDMIELQRQKFQMIMPNLYRLVINNYLIYYLNQDQEINSLPKGNQVS